MFTDIAGITKENVTSSLFIGASGPQESSDATVIDDGLTAHVVGGTVDASTVFEVQDKGRTLFFKNILSTVSLEGWTAMPPTIYEAEDATLSNVLVRNDTASASGDYVYTRDGDETSYVEWTVTVPSAGKYLLSLRYGNDYTIFPLAVSS